MSEWGEKTLKMIFIIFQLEWENNEKNTEGRNEREDKKETYLRTVQRIWEVPSWCHEEVPALGDLPCCLKHKSGPSFTPLLFWGMSCIRICNLSVAQHSYTRVYETIYRLQCWEANEPFKRYMSSPLVNTYLPGTILLLEEESFITANIWQKLFTIMENLMYLLRLSCCLEEKAKLIKHLLLKNVIWDIIPTSICKNHSVKLINTVTWTYVVLANSAYVTWIFLCKENH